MKIISIREFQRNALKYIGQKLTLTRYNVPIFEVLPSKKGEILEGISTSLNGTALDAGDSLVLEPKNTLRDFKSTDLKEVNIQPNNQFTYCKKHKVYKTTCGCE